MSSHGHRHFNAEFVKYRMLGQKYFYIGDGNPKVIEFDVHIDWLMIFSDNGTKYGMYNQFNNECWLSGDAANNPSVDNSIQSPDAKVFTFGAVNWSVLNDKYCIIAFGKSPRKVPKHGYAFHKHTKGYDDLLKTQCNNVWFTGTGTGNFSMTIGFNYSVGMICNTNTNRMYFGISPYAYLSYGTRNYHKQGYNAVNPSYELNVLNTIGDAPEPYTEEYKKSAIPDNDLDILGNQYKGFFIGAYHKSVYVFKGGAYPGHKHETGWDDHNRVIGYCENYVGDGSNRSIWFPIPFNADVIILLRHGADNNDCIYINVFGWSEHQGQASTRLTNAGQNVSLVGSCIYVDDYFQMKRFKVNSVGGVNTLNIPYTYIALSIINPKTV